MNLVVIETKSAGKMNPASLETIVAARELGAPVAVVLLEAEESALAAELARQGVERVLVARHPALARYSPDVWVQSLVQVIGQAQPKRVLLPHTYQVRDFAPQLATRMAAPLIADVIGFQGESFIRPMYQGKWSAEVRVAKPETIAFATIQLGAFRGQPATETAAPIELVTVSPTPSLLTAEAPFQEAKQAVDLSQAAIIVAAGRGIKEPKNLDLVKQLADALGGELAASRPICDSGWLPMDRQIGSSGQTVAPKLYVAVGISGAIQHLVGMKGSRTIVAINKDPEAPIFEVADYGVVGNLFEVVPELVRALQSTPA
ncbi:MAG TPA: electron transfer flavoprotein subunit alpha/FixB family protein [Terriglobales bacterium]|jgi:electron transfer flavoprotein alpha subunit